MKHISVRRNEKVAYFILPIFISIFLVTVLLSCSKDEQIKKLIVDLASDNIYVQEKAVEGLVEIGKPAVSPPPDYHAEG